LKNAIDKNMPIRFDSKKKQVQKDQRKLVGDIFVHKGMTFFLSNVN
jgi:hypothetical protein